jgi:hypothetical protein
MFYPLSSGCLYLTVGTLTSVFKDNMTLRSDKGYLGFMQLYIDSEHFGSETARSCLNHDPCGILKEAIVFLPVGQSRTAFMVQV